MKVAIYSRKSVFTSKGESIENQVELCRRYILANLPEVAEEDVTVFEDEGFSAKDTKRPRFQQMLARIRRKEFQCLVCYRLDRVSRSVGDCSQLIEELRDLDVSFVSVTERFDTTTPMGKAMLMVASVFAQLERETLAERVRDNMFMLARTGRWLGGTTPTGFVSEKTEKVDVDGKKRTACKLKHDPEEIRTVRIIFQKFLELHSVSGVYKYLAEAGIRSRSGSWYSKLGIKQILQNPVYCVADKDARDYFVNRNADVCFPEEDCSEELGLLAYNKRDYKKKNAPRQEVSEWIIAIGKHPGIVTGKQWCAVQTVLDGNRPSSLTGKPFNDYCLLSGLIVCGKCGRRMFSRLRRSKGADGVYDYICDGKLQGGKKICDCQNLGGRQTDDMVCDYLMQYADKGSDLHRRLEELAGALKRQQEADPIAPLDAAIAKCEAQLDSLVEQLSQPGLGQTLLPRINTKAEELAKELERLTAEKKRLEENQDRIAGREMDLELVAGALSSFRSCFPEMTLQEKRSLIRLLVQKIVWDGEDLHIFIYGE